MIDFSSPMRRDILQAGAVASAIAALPALAAGEPPPETKRIRLTRYPMDIACSSPMWIAEEMLRAEGFEEVSYVPLLPERFATERLLETMVGADEVDITMSDPMAILPALDEGKQLTVLAGGCSWVPPKTSKSARQVSPIFISDAFQICIAAT